MKPESSHCGIEREVPRLAVPIAQRIPPARFGVLTDGQAAEPRLASPAKMFGMPADHADAWSDGAEFGL